LIAFEDGATDNPLPPAKKIAKPRAKKRPAEDAGTA
jgi:hypothetical protein